MTPGQEFEVGQVVRVRSIASTFYGQVFRIDDAYFTKQDDEFGPHWRYSGATIASYFAAGELEPFQGQIPLL